MPCAVASQVRTFKPLDFWSFRLGFVMKTYVFTNRVYPPVRGATGELLKELAEGLAGADTRVLVVTSRGGGGREEKEVRGVCPRLRLTLSRRLGSVFRSFSEEAGNRGQEAGGGRHTADGVEVIRVGTARFTRASHWRRGLSYLGLYPQLMWQVWKLGRVDAVISMTDPPLQVVAVTLAACRAKKRIHWAQDVYPELAEELGVIVRGGLVVGVLRALSTWVLRRQDEVVAVGRCMRERLIARGVDAGKIEVIPNWSPISAVSADEAAAMRQRFGWNGKFVVLYSGNLGLAHDFETPVEAARLLGGTNVHLVFAGEGPRENELREATKDLPQVSFLPPQAKEELGAFLAAADVHLVTVRAGLEGLVVPSKAYGVMAAGRPMVYVGPAGSEIAQLLSESGAGLVFGNGEARGLAEALKSAASASDMFQRVGAAAMRTAGGWTFAQALAKWREVLADE